nr:MAG TPA: hypothetical protein [Caudoviricetes sp.]
MMTIKCPEPKWSGHLLLFTDRATYPAYQVTLRIVGTHALSI